MSVSRCTCTRDGEGWTETRGCPVHDDTLAQRQGETIHDMTVQIASLRHALKTVRAECDLPDYIAEFIGDALSMSKRDTSAADVDGITAGHHESVGERQGRQPAPAPSDTEGDARLVLDALDLGLQAWRTTSSRDRFVKAVGALGRLREAASTPASGRERDETA